MYSLYDKPVKPVDTTLRPIHTFCICVFTTAGVLKPGPQQGFLTLVIKDHCPTCFTVITALSTADYLDQVYSVIQKPEDIISGWNWGDKVNCYLPASD